MRKVLTVVFVVLMATFLLAEVKELNTIFGPEDLNYYIERNEKFYDETGVRVNITVVPYGRDQNIKLIASMLAGGSQYDIFIIDCVEVPMYVESGWVLPIDEWLTEDLKKDAVPFALSGMAYEGHWYGLPWVSEWKSFVYNREMIKKVGYHEFPKTWDEVIELSKKLQQAGIVKYATEEGREKIVPVQEFRSSRLGVYSKSFTRFKSTDCFKNSAE